MCKQCEANELILQYAIVTRPVAAFAESPMSIFVDGMHVVVVPTMDGDEVGQQGLVVIVKADSTDEELAQQILRATAAQLPSSLRRALQAIERLNENVDALVSDVRGVN